MAVFHESDAATAGGSKKLSPVIIAVIIAVVLLCCCCVAAIIILVATGTITSSKIEDLTSQNHYLPQYLALLQTWL
jgi:flagellar basal body-associated protein FliL